MDILFKLVHLQKPTDSYVNGIQRSANLKYKVYQENVNGTTYNKVLIGPYSSKNSCNRKY